MPDGHFLGWTPGKRPYREPEGLSWKLERASDLVVQLHMPTTGKPEKVSARVGLFFADAPARVVPVTLRLGSREMDIPAGAKDYRNEDAYVLPVDVRVLSIIGFGALNQTFRATVSYSKAHKLSPRMVLLAGLAFSIFSFLLSPITGWIAVGLSILFAGYLVWPNAWRQVPRAAQALSRAWWGEDDVRDVSFVLRLVCKIHEVSSPPTPESKNNASTTNDTVVAVDLGNPFPGATRCRPIRQACRGERS